MIWNLLTWKPRGGYHFNNSHRSREAEGAPGSGVGYLGLGLAVFFPRKATLRAILNCEPEIKLSRPVSREFVGIQSLVSGAPGI